MSDGGRTAPEAGLPSMLPENSLANPRTSLNGANDFDCRFQRCLLVQTCTAAFEAFVAVTATTKRAELYDCLRKVDQIPPTFEVSDQYQRIDSSQIRLQQHEPDTNLTTEWPGLPACLPNICTRRARTTLSSQNTTHSLHLSSSLPGRPASRTERAVTRGPASFPKESAP